MSVDQWISGPIEPLVSAEIEGYAILDDREDPDDEQEGEGNHAE